MSPNSESIDELYRQAVQFHRRGDLDQAERIYRRVLERSSCLFCEIGAA